MPANRRRLAMTSPNFTARAIELRDDTWGDRCAYWFEQANAVQRQPAAKKRRAQLPLVLTGHGVCLRIEGGSLLVQNGFTHYPQERQQWRLFAGDWRLPSRIVILDCDGSLTFDALAWLAQHRVPLVQINWKGDVVHVAGALQTIDTGLVAVQLAARNDERRRIAISRRLIAEKINNSIETLRIALPRSPAFERALQRLQRDAIDVKKPGTIGGLLGIEGRAGLAYFGTWQSFPVRWKETSRRPIPSEWQRIGQRSSYVAKKSNPNRGATHPINAMLNYAYAVLETQVRAHVIGAGLDPTIGFFHGSYPVGKTALVYDLMEPLRPIVDRAVLQFVQRATFSSFDFSVTPKGVCRLNPQLARNVVRMIEAIPRIDAIVRSLVSEISSSHRHPHVNR
jgi:CRISP-associated protein Cas1